MKIILVCGGRNFKDYNFLRDTLDKITSDIIRVFIIAGGARGADRLAIDWAVENQVPFKEYPANWDDLSEPCFPKVRGSKVYNALAGQKRNQQMLDEGKPDLVVAFPGGSGTADMVNRAKKAGVEVIEVINGPIG